MTDMNPNLEQDPDEAEESRARMLRATFGPDVFVGLATDPAPASSSAGRIAEGLAKRARERRRERRNANLAEAQKLHADADAYDRVVVQGQQASVQDKIRAEAHGRRIGTITPKSSSQLLAERYQRRKAGGGAA